MWPFVTLDRLQAFLAEQDLQGFPPLLHVGPSDFLNLIGMNCLHKGDFVGHFLQF
jgi:hypothetical protein